MIIQSNRVLFHPLTVSSDFGHLLLRRSFVTSSSIAAPAAAAAPGMSGDVAGVLAGIEAVVSGDAVTPKDIADAAMSLTLLKAKGDRR